MQINNCQIKIIQADITELKVEAIVNAANNKLVMGGGVAGAIKKKGGGGIEQEAVGKGPIKIGDAVYTHAGNLPCKFVIHAATMGMDFVTDENKIRKSCASSLKVADQIKVKTIAFPALGCGVGGFPYLACAKVMAQEVFRHLRETPNTSLREIIFCLYKEEDYKVFKDTVFKYLEYITKKIKQGPFITVDAIIELDEGIIVIKRSNPPFGWALPGGFVDYGESLEQAVVREAREETGLDLKNLEQFHTYSCPERDPRFHSIGTVFIAKAKGKPKAGDDAAGVKIVKLNQLQNIDFAFDHKQIIQDYLQKKKGGKT